MSKLPRRHYSADQKAAILKRHYIEKIAISDVCDESKLQPSVFYYWQKQLFENAPAVFEAPKAKAKASRERELEARVAQLEAKLARKDAVIAEVTEELVRTKKELGEP